MVAGGGGRGKGLPVNLVSASTWRKKPDEIRGKRANSVLPQIDGSLHSAVSAGSWKERLIDRDSHGISLLRNQSPEESVCGGEPVWSVDPVRTEYFDPVVPVRTGAANVAQLAEQLICNQPVVGSNPSVGSCSPLMT